MFKFFKIKGDSMNPIYEDGDFVLVLRRNSKKLKIGDKIIFNHSLYGRMVKSIKEIESQGFVVEGTNQHSLDYRQLGLIPPKDILGKVIWRIAKKKSRTANGSLGEMK